MSGAKGRSGGARKGSGGARPGAGRKRKKPLIDAQTAANQALSTLPLPPADLSPSKQTPLEYLTSVYQDDMSNPVLRVRAAVAAAQYVHTKTHDGGKKEAAAERSKSAAVGKFAPKGPPKLVVSNG